MFGLHGAELAALLAAVFVIGALIGSIGIGGLLLAPMLVGVAGLDVRSALAVSMASFIATGLAALVLFARGGADAAGRWPLIVSTMPGALAGALLLWATPEWLAVAVLAAFLVASGLRVLVSDHGASGAPEPVLRRGDMQLGAATGFLSALTGTGGPMVLVPLLAWRGAPLMAAIALGQIVQLPISGMATIGNLVGGRVDLTAALSVGLVLVPGVFAGRKAIARVSLAALTRIVALVLIAAGCWLAWRMF